MPRAITSLDDDAFALLDAADPADEEFARLELRLQRGGSGGRQGHEQAACCLRVIAERDERLGDAVELEVPPGEVAVARVAARANALACKVERSVDRRETRRLEPDPDAAPLGDLVRVPEEPEARHVRDCVRLVAAQNVGRLV